MEFRLPFIEDIQRFQVKNFSMMKIVPFFCDNNLIKSRLTCIIYSTEIFFSMSFNEVDTEGLYTGEV